MPIGFVEAEHDHREYVLRGDPLNFIIFLVIDETEHSLSCTGQFIVIGNLSCWIVHLLACTGQFIGL